MGHQADDVAGLIADSGDVVHRPIRVVDVAQHDTLLITKLRECLLRARVITLEMVDRQAQQFAGGNLAGQPGMARPEPPGNGPANKSKAPALSAGPREQT